jgi:hypothetical protein
MTLSSNTIWATFYSDGRQIWPHLPSDDGSLFICSACNEYLRRSDLRKPSFIAKTIKSNKHYLDNLKLEDYIKILSTDHITDPWKEFHIRKRILWMFNDRIRKVTWIIQAFMQSEEERQVWNKNLERLLEIYQTTPWPNNDQEELEKIYLAQAEILRESKRFDECVSVLDTVENEKFDKVKEKLRKACEEQNPYVIAI